jgi:hypothetical protein
MARQIPNQFGIDHLTRQSYEVLCTANRVGQRRGGKSGGFFMV